MSTSNIRLMPNAYSEVDPEQEVDYEQHAGPLDLGTKRGESPVEPPADIVLLPLLAALEAELLVSLRKEDFENDTEGRITSFRDRMPTFWIGSV